VPVADLTPPRLRLALTFALSLACTATEEPEPPSNADATSDDGTDPTTTAPSDDAADDAGTTSGTTDGSTPTGPLDGTITWHRDVRPLVERSCLACHRAGNIAPFTLESYDETWPLREAIASVVAARTMPPWLPGPGCTEYQGDPSLTDDEIATFVGWAEEDGPLGDPNDYAPLPSPEIAGLSRVDLDVSLPVPYTPQASPDDYRCFLADWPHDTTTYVTGFAARPDRVEEVHHVIVYAIEPAQVAQYEALDAAEEGPGYTCFGGPGGTSLSSAGTWLGAWAPGGQGSDYPEGVGLRMDPGSKIVVQIHYNTLATDPAPDQTTVQFRLDDTVEREGFMLLWADIDWLGGDMPIPAGSPSTVHTWALDPTFVMEYLTDVIPPGSPFLMYTASHHMHQLGVRGRSEIERADGSVDCLLDIPRWDFDWQKGHGFTEPKRFEPGDTLRLSCEFDNSAGKTDVNWGEGTGDEMCLGVFFISGE
jgi:hypothetical protein